MADLPPSIIVIPDFLSEAECAAHIAACEERGFEAAMVTTLTGPARDPSLRNNDRVIFDDLELAASVWERLESHVPVMIAGRQAWGLNERWRMYRYHPGQRFARHNDAAFRRANGEQSKLTLLLYLNEDFEGGETTFVEGAVTPKRGTALVFPHELLHAGTEVRSGVKYVLRSDVMYGRIGMTRD